MANKFKWMLASAVALGTPALAAPPQDGNSAYASHRYRNLFVEQLGVSPGATHDKIEHAFQQLFHGDGQEQRIYFETGANKNGTLAYVTDWANNDARSEGMSYGMMIAVQLGHKREFDALWNWSKTYMQVTDPANPSYGYFAWSFNTDGTPRSTGAAPDGEEYYATALLFAARRWGNGSGIYDYQSEADRILHGMRHHAVQTAMPPFRIHPGDAPFVQPDTPWPSPNARREAAAAAAEPAEPVAPHRRFAPRASTVGPMVEEAATMIRFVPDIGGNRTDASYHLPAFYELWARWGPVEDRAFWARTASVSRDFFAKATDPRTGLAPDQSNFDGSPATEWNGARSQFGYDSWRTVSNWSVDFSWWGKDAREPVLSSKVQAFLIGQGLHTFADRYTLAGKPLSDRHSVGMVAAATVGGLAATPGPDTRAFLQALWATPTPSGEQRYFDGLVYLMSMMHCAGEFRIIDTRGPITSSTGERAPIPG